MVIPAQHGMATQYISARSFALPAHCAGALPQAGFDVDCAFTDGDSTNAGNAQQAYGHVQSPQNYAFHSAIHERASVWAGMCVPGTTKGHCFDIDGQGKHSRYTVGKGHALVVFAPNAMGGRGQSMLTAIRCFPTVRRRLALVMLRPGTWMMCWRLNRSLGNTVFCSATDRTLQWREWLSSTSRINMVHGTLRPSSSCLWPWIRLPVPTGALALGLHVSDGPRAIVERPSPGCGLVRPLHRPLDGVDEPLCSPGGTACAGAQQGMRNSALVYDEGMRKHLGTMVVPIHAIPLVD
jgi:hypothetical protein